MYIILDLLVAVLALVYYLLESLVWVLTPSSWKSKEVSGDIVLITGAGSGIGRLLAMRFARLGCKVILVDVNKEGNSETLAMIRQAGMKAFTYECDLTKKEAIYEMAQKVKEEVGKVTILINNAGVVTGKNLLDCPDHKIEQTFAVNTLAHFWTVKAFLPDMLLLDRGHIVTISSLAGYFGINKLTDYCASKFAAIGFDESLRLELKTEGRKNIHTTVVCPYFINTGMFNGVNSKLIPLLTQEMVADAVVDGVLTNTEIVVIPKYFVFMYVLKIILPFRAFDHFVSAAGFNSSMRTFQGRQGAHKD